MKEFNGLAAHGDGPDASCEAAGGPGGGLSSRGKGWGLGRLGLLGRFPRLVSREEFPVWRCMHSGPRTGGRQHDAGSGGVLDWAFGFGRSQSAGRHMG